jgi:gluconolactonase
MKIKNLLFASCLVILMASCNSGVPASEKNDTVAASLPVNDTVRHISILDTEALKLMDTTATIEIIGTGFIWSEGPVFVNDGDYLLFSDVPANRVYKWKEGEGTSVFLTPSGYTGTIPKVKEPGSNGLVIDHHGKLVLCQQGNRQIARMKNSPKDPAPVFETIASSFDGKKFNSPNDAVYAANGNLYFTDPPYGLEHGMQDSTKEISFQGVYCVAPGGKVRLVTDKVSYPNGIALSPDNKYLFISNSDNENKEWLKYELDKEGMPVKESVFYRVSAEEGKLSGNPDGMKINEDGYIFASGPGGIWIFNSAAKVIARIYTGQQTSNCFLDKVHHTLYMTCKSYVMRLKLKSD